MNAFVYRGELSYKKDGRGCLSYLLEVRKAVVVECNS